MVNHSKLIGEAGRIQERSQVESCIHKYEVLAGDYVKEMTHDYHLDCMIPTGRSPVHERFQPEAKTHRVVGWCERRHLVTVSSVLEKE